MDDDDVRRWIRVHDFEGRETPVWVYISQADVERYLRARGWETPPDGLGWWTRGPAGDKDVILCEARAELAALISHAAWAEGTGLRALLRAIEATTDDAPDTERDPA